MDCNIEKKKYYVYVFLDPTKPDKVCTSRCTFLFKPLYVGKGSRYRYTSHGQKWNKLYFNQKLLKMKAQGIEVPSVIIERFYNETEAFALEKLLIKEMGRKNDGTGILYNLTDGGEGTSGAIRTQEFREAVRKRRLGATHTEETKKKISEIRKAAGIKPETRIKMWENHKRRVAAGVVFKRRERKIKPWVLIDPNGKRFEGIGYLDKYLKERGMSVEYLRNTLFSKVPVPSGRMKGWQLFHIYRNPPP